MNIAFGKFGRSMDFNPLTWNESGGDYEPAMFIQNLAKHYPEHTFYLIGKNNYKGDFENIIDIWSIRPKEIDQYDWLDQLELDIDFGMFFAGPVSRANIPNFLRKKDGDFYKPLVMFKNYSGPIIHYLNKTEIPWFYFSCDIRYIPPVTRDIHNLPLAMFAQYRDKCQMITIKSEEDHSLVTTEYDYDFSMLETLWCLTQEYPMKSYEKDIDFAVILNQGDSTGDIRLSYLNDYIFSQFEDVGVYGKWKSEILDSDDRFRGPLKFQELNKLLPRIKYSILFPLTNGWITTKFWECIHYDIIPFFHHKYDDLNYFDVPDFLRLKKASDLKHRINELERNSKLYEEILFSLRELRDENYYNGKYLANYLQICKKQIDVINK